MVENVVENTEQFIVKLMSKKISFKGLSLTTFEKVTLSIIFVILFFTMIATVFTRSEVNSANASIENLKIKTATIHLENQILQQKIDDLMTHERINEIAQKYDLKHIEENIKSVTK